MMGRDQKRGDDAILYDLENCGFFLKMKSKYFQVKNGCTVAGTAVQQVKLLLGTLTSHVGSAGLSSGYPAFSPAICSCT